MSINELAKKIKDKYGIPVQTINNLHSELRITNLAHVLAIMGVLHVPLERLVREDVESAEGLEGYEDFRNGVEGLLKVYNKAYKLSMSYDIHRSEHVSHFKLICSVGSLLDNIYPEKV